MVDKLSKALEGLKNIQFTSVIEDGAVRKKEKMLSCVLVADLVVSLKLTSAQNFPQLLSVMIESYIHLCDDKDSDVRMVADENLNRIIRALAESNMLKVLIELHKEIKKNGPARCLRAALWRFGALAQCIRPNKGRGHVQNLLPCLLVIAKREEESVHETLALSLPNIFQVLGVFTQDNDIKNLLKVFLQNLSSSNAVIRRSSASCIITIVQYCRKPYVFNSYLLNTLLDCVVPVSEDHSTFLILGVLNCLRMLLPHLTCDRNDEGLSGSFGSRRKQDESLLSVDRLIQTYELCLHYTKNKDHNVVVAALETLNQILHSPPQHLEIFLLSPAGFSRSYIHSVRDNRLWQRSGSEMSVACSLTGGDENLLFDESDVLSPFTSISTSELDPRQPKPKSKFEFSDEGIKMVDSPFKDKLLGEILETQSTPEVDSDSESVAVDVNNPSTFFIGVKAEEKEHSESRDCSRCSSRDDLSTAADLEGYEERTTIDVGSFTDTAVPLIYCARHLAASFLLDGTPNSMKSDRSVRVSVKSLVISCMSAIVKVYPVALKMELTKSHDSDQTQEMRDILLFSEHSDPQIRGGIIILVGSFLNAATLESKGIDLDWFNNEKSKLNFNSLLSIIFEGLKDKSSVCSRQALSGLQICLKSVLFSVRHHHIFPLLKHLPAMADNSYWLLKVKLVEVLSDLPFVCIHEMTGSTQFQDEVFDTVLLPLLGDEDSRVRSAAAETLVKMIPRLYFGNSTVLNYSRNFTEQIKKCLKLKKENNTSYNHSFPCPPFSYLFSDDVEYDQNLEESLSRVVTRLTYALLKATNRYSVFGYIEALKLLSQRYPTTIYLKGWNCFKPKSDKTAENDTIASSLLNVILSLLVTSPMILDLSAFSSATVLLGNLFAGYCVCNLKNDYQVAVGSPTAGPVEFWNVFKNREMSQMAEQILTHLLKMLNIYSHLLEEVPLSKVASSTASATALLPLSLPSPIKKPEKKADKDEKIEEKKPKNFSNYRHSPQYFKLYQLLKNAHNNYKISLETSVSDKFLDLLESTVNALSILLEVGTVQDTGRCAEEILSYLRPVVSLRASPSVICVIQLLKSLFGINLASNWEEIKSLEQETISNNLFRNVYQLPSEFLLERVRSHASSITLESETLVGTRRRTDRKVIIKNTDKNCLATYIRLFEPMVIKSLKLYTITNDVELQSNVLKLLNQLVQLRVNYCLLDADETFVGFVLKEFELIEHGQIPNVEVLLPDIFKFLVLLSYEKHHSKNIMSVPKILQLCDGLMASNQPTQTHCIPALIPIVEDVFLSRSLVSSTEQKELETQREVLLAMLLRLVEFHQVMNMLAIILNESRTVEERERWKRWSRQVVDTVLPLASQSKLHTETFEGQDAFSKLMASLSPNVLRPINPLLNVLFTEPHDYNCSMSLKRWLSRITVMLESILHVKEDVLLNRLEEIAPNINLNTFLPPGKLYSPDPFNVRSSFQTFESAETFARFLLKGMSVSAYKILESVSSSLHLQEQLSVFFVCVFHILISGTFHRITNALQNLIISEQESISTICSMFIDLTNISPMLTCQFAYFLALLNYCDRGFWDKILVKPNTFSSKLVQSCGVVALADYLCENLSDVDTLSYLLMGNIKEVILLSNETPIKELLTSIQRRANECNLIMKAVSSQDIGITDGRLVEKLLRILEISDNTQSGALICVLVKRFLASKHLPLSRLASSLACRRVEFLLTLPPDQAHEQLDKDTFNELMNFIKDRKMTKKHSNLMGLLNKLSMQVYDLSPLDLNRSRALDPEKLKNVKLGEEWFFNQVKEKCCQENYPGREMASLLSKLSYDRMVEVMYCKKFNVHLLKDCLLFREMQRKKNILDLNPGNEGEPSTEDLLFKAAKSCLLILVGDVHDRIQRIQSEHRFSEDGKDLYLDKLCENILFYNLVWKIAPALIVLLNTVHYEPCDIGKEYLEAVAEFGVLCLEVISWLIRKENSDQNETKFKLNQNILENGITCSAVVLKNHDVNQILSQPVNNLKLKSCIQNAFYILNHLIPQYRFPVFRETEGSVENAYPEINQLEFLLKFIMTKSNDALLPNYLRDCFRNLIINLCRIPELSLHILKVPESSDMQDIELLENFISKFSVIGWTSRQQFEEIWVGLLAVLGFNTQGNTPLEETAFLVQASTGAVEGITTLLKNTLLNSANRKLIHHGRDSTSMKNMIKELPLVSNFYSSDQFSDRCFHFLYNLEMDESSDKYYHGLLSVEYIWVAVKQNNNRLELYEKHSKELDEIGLDLTSCVHLLIEVYSQWINQPSPDIRLITSSLKSSIVISDLFTDIAQFQWLLDFCLGVVQFVILDDVVILPLIILGSCKAVSIILPDLEVCEKIKRLMMRWAHNIPCKIATIQGLLYLLQSPVISAAINHTTVVQQSDKSTFQQDENNFAMNIVDMFLSVALDIVQQFKLKTWPMNEECEKCSWALVFYLLHHYQSSLGESKEEMLNFILTALRNRTSSDSVMSLLVRGIERLLLTSVIDERFLDQVCKISLEMISQSSFTVYRNGLQLLMVLSFLDKKTKDIRQLVTGHDDPEKIMRGMEMVNVLFERLKKSYPDEAEVIADVINYVLKDFNAPDVLTKVIQEFLSSHQPHLKLLSGLLFKVFERAELSLLQDWVVMTLPSFTQGLPVAMSIWTLNCFFVSASSEPWLRSMFPLVQSRLRMTEVEDKKLLCLAGSHFYNQLTDDKQKKLFITTFENASKSHIIFNDLLSLLR